MIYDANGVVISPSAMEEFTDNITVEHKFDEVTQTEYSLVRVSKIKTDGTEQYPFVYAPNGAGGSTKSALEMNRINGFCLAINAGVGANAQGGGYTPIGVLIQNGTLIQQGSHPNLYQLTIDEDGNLGYQNPDTDGETLIANGIVSALCGFCPLVVDYDAVDSSFYNWITHYEQKAQRQIIGQFGNGDYVIMSSEGRSFDNSEGWTLEEAILVCQKNNLKFAFNLDGGGSVETVIGKKQINIIYENQSGRAVPNYIVFNGTDTFGMPR